MCWNSSKIISRLISLTILFSADPSITFCSIDLSRCFHSRIFSRPHTGCKNIVGLEEKNYKFIRIQSLKFSIDVSATMMLPSFEWLFKDEFQTVGAMRKMLKGRLGLIFVRMDQAIYFQPISTRVRGAQMGVWWFSSSSVHYKWTSNVTACDYTQMQLND